MISIATLACVISAGCVEISRCVQDTDNELENSGDKAVVKLDNNFNLANSQNIQLKIDK